MSHKYEKLDVLQTASVAVCVNVWVLQLIHNTAPSHRRRPTDLCKLRVCHAVDLEGGGGEVTLMHGHWVDVSITCDVIGLEHWLVCLYVQVPVILALVGIWYSNFFGAETYTLLPYDQVSEACVYWIELNFYQTTLLTCSFHPLSTLHVSVVKFEQNGVVCFIVIVHQHSSAHVQYWYRSCVHLSVHSSVTLQYCIETA